LLAIGLAAVGSKRLGTKLVDPDKIPVRMLLLALMLVASSWSARCPTAFGPAGCCGRFYAVSKVGPPTKRVRSYPRPRQPLAAVHDAGQNYQADPGLVRR